MSELWGHAMGWGASFGVINGVGGFILGSWDGVGGFVWGLGVGRGLHFGVINGVGVSIGVLGWGGGFVWGLGVGGGPYLGSCVGVPILGSWDGVGVPIWGLGLGSPF